jgi:hypothetical protein
MIHLTWIPKECHECGEEYKGCQFDNNLCRYCKRTHEISRIAYVLEKMLYYKYGE